MTVITPAMSLLEIVELSPQAEEVFHQYDDEAGCCLLCNNLFDPLEEVARIYSLDLNQILAKLRKLNGAMVYSVPHIQPQNSTFPSVGRIRRQLVFNDIAIRGQSSPGPGPCGHLHCINNPGAIHSYPGKKSDFPPGRVLALIQKHQECKLKDFICHGYSGNMEATMVLDHVFICYFYNTYPVFKNQLISHFIPLRM
jgi:hypothetical protein